MPTIKLPQTKNFLFDILSGSDFVDANGKGLPLEKFHAHSYAARKAILKKLQGDCVVECEKDGVKETVPLLEYTKDHGKQISTAIKGGELELTDKEVKCIKGYYNDRTKLMDISDEAFDEFEALIEDKKNVSK